MVVKTSVKGLSELTAIKQKRGIVFLGRLEQIATGVKLSLTLCARQHG